MLRQQRAVKDRQIGDQTREIERITVMHADAQGTICGLLNAGSAGNAPASRARRVDGGISALDEKTPQRGAERTIDPFTPPRRRALRARLFLGGE
jgi:hypothetical protein